MAEKQLNHTLNEFEQLFLHSKGFMIGDNISYADLLAICEIDQPSNFCMTEIPFRLLLIECFYLLFPEYIGFNPFIHRPKLDRWYKTVRDELGTYYKEVTHEFDNKLRTAEKSHKEAISLKQ